MGDWGVESWTEEHGGYETHIWSFLDGEEEALRAEHNADMSKRFTYTINSALDTQEAERFLQGKDYSFEEFIGRGRNRLNRRDGDEVILELAPEFTKIYASNVPLDLMAPVLQNSEDYSEEEAMDLLEAIQDELSSY